MAEIGPVATSFQLYARKRDAQKSPRATVDPFGTRYSHVVAANFGRAATADKPRYWRLALAIHRSHWRLAVAGRGRIAAPEGSVGLHCRISKLLENCFVYCDG